MCFILEAIREIPKNQISIWTRTRLGYVFGMSCVKWRQIIRKFISDLVFYIVKPNKNFRLLDNDRRNHRLYTVFSKVWASRHGLSRWECNLLLFFARKGLANFTQIAGFFEIQYKSEIHHKSVLRTDLHRKGKHAVYGTLYFTFMHC